MGKIHLLSQDTVNRIAAGEVIERPMSVVKELCENALDAGATAITVECTNGGTSYIRITDNGSGIAKEDIPTAFLPHATSKITDESDLFHIRSLGFRGEALSSIASVSKTELLTKRKDDFLGSRYVIEGGTETVFEDAGCPDGTSFFIRDLFYNVPARRKFLKSAITEAGYINELINRYAVCRPDVSFSLILNGRTVLHTSGNNNRMDAVYSVFGREITENLIPINYDGNYLRITGFAGKSVLCRGNRNYEMFFVNGRTVRSGFLSKAIEDAYAPYMMQHKYPFTVLLLEADPEGLDVNIHPTKADVRFTDQEETARELREAISEALHRSVLIPDAGEEVPKEKPVIERPPESFETKRMELSQGSPATPYPAWKPAWDSAVSESKPVSSQVPFSFSEPEEPKKRSEQLSLFEPKPDSAAADTAERPDEVSVDTDFERLRKNVDFRLIGQVFKTYWLIETEGKLYIIDQHAAHEKIIYERMVKAREDGENYSQMLMPSIVVSLSIREEQALTEAMEDLNRIGFRIEPFGGRDYQITAVPAVLYRMDAKDYFMSVLDALSDDGLRTTPERVYETLATISCKAAIKGNQAISELEAKHLFTELLSLENPFHCPHGRPIIISMTEYELERKFKRIV